MNDYFTAAGISSHKLADFRKSPRLFYRKHVMSMIPEADADWMVFGRAVHALTLEGREAFDKRFCVRPEGIDRRTKDGKAAYEAFLCGNEGKAVIDGKDMALCETMARRVRENPIAGGMLSSGAPEVERFAKHAATGLELKGKCDWLGTGFDGKALIADLKTCGDLDQFPADAAKYGYVNQMAFYGALFNVPHLALIAVEKAEPNRVGVFRYSATALASATLVNDAALDQLRVCFESDFWPCDPDSIITLDVA